MSFGAPMRCRLEVPGLELELDTDPARLDLTLIHEWLSKESYWAKGMPEAVLRKGIANSLCFGLYRMDREDEDQIAFCRMVTDLATFGWLSDGFVLPEYRGKGISKALVAKVMSHPDLQGFRRMLLGTKDAHALYERFGFTALAKPEMYMEIWKPDVYGRGTGQGQAG